MPSTTLNIITTSLLTLLCSLTLFILYRRALRPIIKKYHMVPLRTFREYRDRVQVGGGGGGYMDVPQEEDEVEVERRRRRLSRDLEEGFGVSDSEDEGEEEGGQVVGGRGTGRREEGVGLGIRM